MFFQRRPNETFAKRRERLLTRLQRSGHLRGPRVTEAMSQVPRELFVPPSHANRAYDDSPVEIGHGQTISAPHMVAIMSEALEAGPGMKVLEVGTGSGYQAAILGHLVQPEGHVITVERIPELAERARQSLAAAKAHNVEVHAGDGSLGHSAAAPFDRILVTAAAPDVPPPLLAQLANGGRLVVPVGRQICDLIRVTRTESGFSHESLGACAFVPLVGAHGQHAASLAA